MCRRVDFATYARINLSRFRLQYCSGFRLDGDDSFALRVVHRNQPPSSETNAFAMRCHVA